MLMRGTFVDCPRDPFAGGDLRSLDGALLVRDGVIVARGGFGELAEHHQGEAVTDLRGGLLVPGFVDTHVHYPQVRVIGGLGLPLLEWLDRCALPEEQRLVDAAYARVVAREFLAGLASAGTTSALVFGAHYASAMDEFFAEAEASGLRIASGVVVSDRELPGPLLTTPERALADAVALAGRWHGRGRLRYAVTPRFSYSCTDALLGACGDALGAIDGALFTSHVNENAAEIAGVEAHFGCSYVDTYDRHGLLSCASVLAHDVHPSDAELATLAARGTAVSHCPCSNSAIGSGMFPLKRHLDAGVRVALGSDVGGGTSFSLLKEGLQAAFVQSLLGAAGRPLGPAELLWLATRAGALALALPDVGAFDVGQRFDAVWARPHPGRPFDVCLRHAADVSDAVAKLFTVAETCDLAGAWVDGVPVGQRSAD